MLSFADIFTCFRVRAVFVCGGAAMALAKAGIPEDKGGNLYVRDYSLDGLAVAWDNCRVVRQRLRNRSNLLRHRCPKLKESFNTKVERSAFNVRENAAVLRPVLGYVASQGAAPTIERLVEQIRDLLADCKAQLIGQTLHQQAWAIRHLLSLLKKNSAKPSWRKDPVTRQLLMEVGFLSDEAPNNEDASGVLVNEDAGGVGCLEAAAFADTLVDFETQESEAPVAETQVVEAEAPVAETRVEAKAPEAETRVVEADAAEAPEAEEILSSDEEVVRRCAAFVPQTIRLQAETGDTNEAPVVPATNEIPVVPATDEIPVVQATAEIPAVPATAEVSEAVGGAVDGAGAGQTKTRPRIQASEDEAVASKKAKNKKSDEPAEDESAEDEGDEDEGDEAAPTRGRRPKAKAKCKAKAKAQMKAKAKAKSKAKASPKAKGKAKAKARALPEPDDEADDVPKPTTKRAKSQGESFTRDKLLQVQKNTKLLLSKMAKPRPLTFEGVRSEQNLPDPDHVRDALKYEIMQNLVACNEFYSKVKHQHIPDLDPPVDFLKFEKYWSRASIGIRRKTEGSKVFQQFVYFSRPTVCVGTNLILAKYCALLMKALGNDINASESRALAHYKSVECRSELVAMVMTIFCLLALRLFEPRSESCSIAWSWSTPTVSKVLHLSMQLRMLLQSIEDERHVQGAQDAKLPSSVTSEPMPSPDELMKMIVENIQNVASLFSQSLHLRSEAADRDMWAWLAADADTALLCFMTAGGQILWIFILLEILLSRAPTVPQVGSKVMAEEAEEQNGAIVPSQVLCFYNLFSPSIGVDVPTRQKQNQIGAYCDRSLMILFDIMTEHWGEDADAEADGPAAVAPAEVFEAPPAPEPRMSWMLVVQSVQPLKQPDFGSNVAQAAACDDPAGFDTCPMDIMGLSFSMDVTDTICISDDEAPAIEPSSPGVLRTDAYYEDLSQFVDEVEKELEDQLAEDSTPAPVGTTIKMIADAAETEPTVEAATKPSSDATEAEATGEATTKPCTVQADATEAEATGEAATKDSLMSKATAVTGASKTDDPDTAAICLEPGAGEMDVHEFKVKCKELQTPEKPSKPRKSSDKPKPSKVAKADAEKHSKPSKAAKADAEKPSKAKKAKEAEPVTSADVAKDGDGKRKRRRFENFEDKSFARRTRPQGEYTGLQWQAIRDVFFEKLNTQFSAPSFHQAFDLGKLVRKEFKPKYKTGHQYVDRIYPPLFARRVVNMVLPARAHPPAKPAEGSAETVPSSTSTLGRGLALLNNIANDGVVKEEPVEEEAELLKQMEELSAKIRKLKSTGAQVDEDQNTDMGEEDAASKAARLEEVRKQTAAAEKKRQELARAGQKAAAAEQKRQELALAEQKAAAAEKERQELALAEQKAAAAEKERQELALAEQKAAAAEKERQELARAEQKAAAAEKERQELALAEQKAAAAEKARQELARAEQKAAAAEKERQQLALAEQKAAAAEKERQELALAEQKAAAAAEKERQELARAEQKAAAAEKERQQLALAEQKAAAAEKERQELARAEQKAAAAEKERQELARAEQKAAATEKERLLAERRAAAAELADLEAAQLLLREQAQEAAKRRQLAEARVTEVEAQNAAEEAAAKQAKLMQQQIRAEAHQATQDITRALEEEHVSAQQLAKAQAEARKHERDLAVAKAKLEAARANLSKTPEVKPSPPSEVWTQDAQPPDIEDTQRCLSFGGCSTPTPTEPCPPTPDSALPAATGKPPEMEKPPPPAGSARPNPAPQQAPDQPSRLTLMKRINRAMEPNAKGEFKVAEKIREQWRSGGKEGVFKLFAECGNDSEAFIKRFSVTRESEKEMQVGVEFEFLTKQDMAEDQRMTEDEIDACVAAAEKDPERMMKATERVNIKEEIEHDATGNSMEMEIDGTMLPNLLKEALDSVMKRLKQLGEVRGMYAKLVINEPKEPDENKDKQVRPEQELQKKMKMRLDAMYQSLDEGHDKLQSLQSNGLLDGYKKELFVGIGVVRMSGLRFRMHVFNVRFETLLQTPHP
ncbi:unnamed protein product [Symbiodinium microadriaticum]|nr:unnamed protein product [Symbiodinium microadriaticum]